MEAINRFPQGWESIHWILERLTNTAQDLGYMFKTRAHIRGKATFSLETTYLGNLLLYCNTVYFEY
jgi:hypothetical protein